jgi:hypothetical protein
VTKIYACVCAVLWQAAEEISAGLGSSVGRARPW